MRQRLNRGQGVESSYLNPCYKSAREQRPRRNCFRTDFHKLFVVKMDKMINKKTGTSFLVVYVIYCSLVYTDSKKLCLVYSPDCRLHSIYATLRGNQNANLYAYRAVYVCSIMSLTIRIGLYLFLLSNSIINLMYNIIK